MLWGIFLDVVVLPFIYSKLMCEDPRRKGNSINTDFQYINFTMKANTT